MKITDKQAFFIDYNGNEQRAEIRINEGIFISINTFNQSNNPTGYMHLFYHQNNRWYLDVIYCYDAFRRAKIATYISELADYLLRDYIGYVIKGVYEPQQLSTDRENKIERSRQELDLAARKFYEKAGYAIIDYEDFLNDEYKYYYLMEDDFCCGEVEPGTIVAKEIVAKNYAFFEENGIIYQAKREINKTLCNRYLSE